MNKRIRSAKEKIETLMYAHPKGYDLNLQRISVLLEKLGNPQERIPPVIHVAGTNGKGSTIAFMRSILEANGLAVHVHTSPHIFSWHERYRIGQYKGKGKFVDDEKLSIAIDKVAAANGNQNITVFEILVAVMFILFSENPADVSLVEVGLGGRLDATNVIHNPAITVITPISFDHEALLGEKLSEIAFSKAGIIKNNVPVIVSAQKDEVIKIIEQQASYRLAPIQIMNQNYLGLEKNGQLIYQDKKEFLSLPLPRMYGSHQISNATVAISAVRALSHKVGFSLTQKALERGILEAEWLGRMQRIKQGPLINMFPQGSEVWLDGGHNPGAAKVIADFMKELEKKERKKLILICGMLKTKDASGYFNEFKCLAKEVLTVSIKSRTSSYNAEELSRIAYKCGLKTLPFPSLYDAMLFIKNHTKREKSRILICGSLYLVNNTMTLNEITSL
ncbi:folylpolyglutamate synthase/dihydrofolate synthase family protein [Candidatus Endowatersipora endosymbiont of Watersipora subatra]|uniref:bifunctional folylpolyglutamate synthase/dihydrofolate synthase n=1 Tax=Candidatus Endowatersipora endosymbiont of Watersipora subatra TaxID=3077946 RepID=UPI00312CBF4F